MKNAWNVLLAYLLIFTLVPTLANAQLLQGKEARQKITAAEMIRYKANINYPVFIKFDQNKQIPKQKIMNWLGQNMELAQEISFEPLRERNDQLGMTHQRLQQLWKDIPVKAGMLITHEKDGLIQSVNGEVFDSRFDNHLVISPTSALQLGLSEIAADVYKGKSRKVRAAETMNSLEEFKTPELTIVPRDLDYNNPNFHLTYEVQIYALEPLQKIYLYIDAETGLVVAEENRLCSVDTEGTAVTKNVGTVQIMTDSVGPNQFLLQESGRGGGIITINDNTGAVFEDDDNYWDNVNAEQDEVATDAHYGAEATYDYYFLEHGLNSVDGAGFPLTSIVHLGNDVANAFWDGTAMSYGDGSPGSELDRPLTTLDVCGHEITHGVTEFSAGLIYAGESGALNESFSDIFGNVIEDYRSTLDWRMGELATSTGLGIRNMADPFEFDNPDTYQGDGWDPAEGVHDNSGVQNFWFYLLVEGGADTNDNGDAYTVNGLGMETAGDIAYRNLSVYLTPSSNYADARFYALQSATDLYGGCSNEIMQTANAWHAVGVGLPFSPVVSPDFLASRSFVCELPGEVSFNSLGIGIDSYLWDFGDGTTSMDPSPTHTYSQLGDYDVKLVVQGCNGSVDSLTKPQFITVNPESINCDTTTMDLTSVTRLDDCAGILLDPGGNFDYSNGMNSTAIIEIPFSGTLELTFSEFQLESNYDYLYIYDGTDNTFPLIGTYTGGNVPNGGQPIPMSNGAATIVIISDGSVTAPGFVMNWNTVGGNVAPVVGFTFPSPSPTSFPVMFDNQTNVTSEWHWDFGDGTSAFDESPSHVYANPGTYDVTLIAANCSGADTLTQTIVIDGSTQLGVNPDTLCVTLQKGQTASLPVTITNNGSLLGYYAEVGGFETTIESSDLEVYEVDAATTIHTFPGIAPSLATMDISVTIEGDYSDAAETASLYIEGDFIETINDGNVADGTPITTDYTFNGAQLTTWLADGELSVTIVNSNDVNINTANDNHEVSVSYLNSWLDLSELDGTLGGNSQSTANVLFDATQVEAGTYTYNAVVALNDPNNMEETIFCKMIVEGPTTTTFSTENTYNCDGVVAFTDYSFGDPISWAWDFGDGNTSTLQSPVHTYLTAGIYDVTLITCNATGCNTLTRQDYVEVDFDNAECNVYYIPTTSSETITQCTGTLFDHAGPNADYDNNVNGTTYLQPANAAQVTLTFTFFEFETGFDYLFIYDGPDANSPLIDFFSGNTLPNGGTITSTGNALTLVMTTDGSVVYGGFEATWQCSFGGTPTADYSATTLCDGGVQFTDNSQNATSWAWNFGDGTGTSTQQNPIYYYQSSGNYPVELVATNGVGTDTYTESVLVDILEAQMTTVDTAYIGSFDDFLNDTPNAVSWIWDFGNGDGSSLENPSYTYPDAGNYTITLTVTDANGCSSTITAPILVIDLGDGIFTPTAAFDFTLFPNPTKGKLQLTYEGKETAEIQVKAYNALGQEVLSNQPQNTATLTETFDLSHLPSGIYFFQLSVADKIVVKKLLVE